MLPLFQQYINCVRLMAVAAMASAFAASAVETPVIVTVDTQNPGIAVPPNFVGVSIFTETQTPGHHGVQGNLFSGTNSQLITLFRNSGIHHLRLGATGSPTSSSHNLPPADIDSLFAFAKATDIKVIYSLHALDAAATAKYVWDNYRPYVDCFAFDNEPDGRALTGGSGAAVDSYTNYISGWNGIAEAVTNVAPGAKFAGPDAAGRVLAPRFAESEKDSGILALITQHIYVDGNPMKKGIDTPHAIENMLSWNWVTNKYPGLRYGAMASVVSNGFPFRLTESDDYTHGVTNASDVFAAALWALDYMHWWAAHGAQGVNFQNTEWLRTDTFYPDASGNFQIHPKAYAIKAFDLGSDGFVEPVKVEDTNNLNLTAYAIGNATGLCVTIINKEHGPGAQDANVTIATKGSVAKSAAMMFLTAPDGDVSATDGVTLGGATITNNAPWEGKWTPLQPGDSGQCMVKVPAATAVLVKLTLQ